MITFHHQSNHPQSQKIKDRLDGLSLRYRLEELKDEDESPFIEDDSRRIQDQDSIEQWLIELEQELNEQRSISGDGCYIDPRSGKVC